MATPCLPARLLVHRAAMTHNEAASARPASPARVPASLGPVRARESLGPAAAVAVVLTIVEVDDQTLEVVRPSR